LAGSPAPFGDEPAERPPRPDLGFHGDSTTMIDPIASIFPSLKGAAASVLCVLAVTGRGMTNQELREWTGYGEPRVRAAVRRLADLGWIAGDSRVGPWSLGDKAPRLLSGGVTVRSAAVAGDESDRAPESGAAAQVRPLTLVQSLRGAPASVLLALSATGRHMTHAELQLWTRWGHNQVTLAVRSLMQLGWVSARSTRGPWRLVTNPRLPVTVSFNPSIASEAPNDGGGSLTPPTEEPSTTGASRRQLLQEIRQCGIQEPTASELAAMPHVTGEYVRAHVQSAAAQGLRVGAAIQRMRMEAPLPLPPKQTDSRRDRARENIRRFLEG
jgi:predicted transcriptional regulator